MLSSLPKSWQAPPQKQHCSSLRHRVPVRFCLPSSGPSSRVGSCRDMSALNVQVVEVDHIVLRVKDPVASVQWYAQTLGLQPVRLEEYKAGTKGVPFPSVRVSPTFLVDFMKAQDFSGDPKAIQSNMDHFCLVVAGNSIGKVRQTLEDAGVAAEEQFDGVVVRRFGAQGNARSIYVRDLDKNVVELRTYLDPGGSPTQQQQQVGEAPVTESKVQEGSGI